MSEVKSPGDNSRHVMNCELFGEKFTAIPSQNSPEYPANHILGIFVLIILTFLTIVLNSITILTIWRSNKLRGTVCFFLIMLQSCADLVVGLFAMPMTTYVVFAEISSAPGGCTAVLIQMKSMFVSIGTSMTIYVAMAYER